jgi:PAS domain-containing protein
MSIFDCDIAANHIAWTQHHEKLWGFQSGQPMRMLGTVVEVTDRKRNEEALSEKEQLLSESQSIAHIGSWVYGLDGRITWTEETYRPYGVSPDTFTPNAEIFDGLIHPEDRPLMRAWITACLAGENPSELVTPNLF